MVKDSILRFYTNQELGHQGRQMPDEKFPCTELRLNPGLKEAHRLNIVINKFVINKYNVTSSHLKLGIVICI